MYVCIGGPSKCYIQGILVFLRFPEVRGGQEVLEGQLYLQSGKREESKQ